MNLTRQASLMLIASLTLLAFTSEIQAQATAASQQAAPTTASGTEVLTIDDYALWRSVGQTSISPDGRWVTYAYTQREVDDSLFVERVGGDEQHVVVRGSGPVFSSDSRWVAYYVNPEETEGGGGGRGGGGGAGAGRGGGGAGAAATRALEMLELATMETRRWEGVTAFGFAEAGDALIIKKRAVDSDAEFDGTDVVVRYLGTAVEELFSYVNEWGLDEAGRRLAYTVDAPDGEANAVKLLDLSTRSGTVLDAEREVTYSRLTWGTDEGESSEDALAVLKGSDEEDLEERENALLMWPSLSATSEPVVLDPRPEEEVEDEGGDEEASEDSAEPASRGIVNGLAEGWVLSEGGALRWAPDASKLFVAAKPQLPVATELCTVADKDDAKDGGSDDGASDEADADESSKEPPMLAVRVGPDGRPLGPEELLDGACPEFIANVDIWHVQDDRIQTIQEARADQDRNRTYQSVVHVDAAGSGPGTPRFVQLADSTMETIEISDDASRAMGRDGREYVSDWRPGYSDYYLVDLDTGDRTPVLDGHLRTLGFSPEGDAYLYWKDRQVWSYETQSGEHTNLTGSVPVTFEDEQFDRFGEKPPHGVAGWTTDGDVILEHRFDLWLQPMDGGAATNLTSGVGAEREMELRIVDMDPDEDEIDLDGPIYLSAYGEWTKQTGFYKLEKGKLEAMIIADARISSPRKAEDADVLLWNRQTFEQSPDYWVSGLDFQDPIRVTDANPQQEEYMWGRRILFDYETHDGVRLQGTLAIPYDYVEGEQRPMIINYYEKNSQNLHSYASPRYQGSPNFAGYVSAGYLVMQPDIHFRIGPSHSEMLESIELAIDVVEEMGYVDPDRIGLHGHSYSGQGSTYISTHSDRFAAIVAGAAATNLVSDFNALWGGQNNAHNYDIYGQGRLGVGLYDDFELYVDQSAVHHAEDMNTPLLLLHGTDDQTVRWMHAVEFYNGLRWFDKNVVLLSYPGEGHGLRQYENQKDFQIRMRQFFNHYLRDAPAARWMEDGRTFVEKERSRAMMDRGGSGGGG